jgi:hypothetical protein
MKTVTVPFHPSFDNLEMPEVAIRMSSLENNSIDCINWRNPIEEAIVTATFAIARSPECLYIQFRIAEGMSLRALYEKDGSPVHKDSCVEFFMRREGETLYRNFEFNCIGVCDAARRISRDEKTPLSDTEYASIRRYSSLGSHTFDEIKGARSWNLTIGIPFSCMDMEKDHLPEKIYGNFYHCADEVETPRYLSWAPVCSLMPDFHRPEFFGEIILLLEDKKPE